LKKVMKINIFFKVTFLTRACMCMCYHKKKKKILT
jgi:hypothetical protein